MLLKFMQLRLSYHTFLDLAHSHCWAQTFNIYKLFKLLSFLCPTFGIGRSLALSEEVPLPPVLDVGVDFEVGHNQYGEGDDP